MTRSRRGRAVLNRRQFAGGVAGLALIPVTGTTASSSEQLSTALKRLAGAAEVRPGRVALDVPALAENGFSVPLTVTVDSPMTAADHVSSIHILSEKNPVADVVEFRLGPRSGRAKVSTSIRVADSQRVMAVARMNDGTFWSGEADVIVTLSACIDES